MSGLLGDTTPRCSLTMRRNSALEGKKKGPGQDGRISGRPSRSKRNEARPGSAAWQGMALDEGFPRWMGQTNRAPQDNQIGQSIGNLSNRQGKDDMVPGGGDCALFLAGVECGRSPALVLIDGGPLICWRHTRARHPSCHVWLAVATQEAMCAASAGLWWTG